MAEPSEPQRASAFRPVPRRERGPAACVHALLALGLAGCGPTDQDIAVSLLAGLALAVPIVAAINAGLYWLWRDAKAFLAPTRAEAAVSSAAMAALAILFLAWIHPIDDLGLVVVALWVVGSSYLTFFSVLVGVALVAKLRWAFRALFWLPALGMSAPLLPIALDVGGVDRIVEPVFMALFWAGALGAIGVPFLFFLWVASVLERKKRRAEAEGAETKPVVF